MADVGDEVPPYNVNTTLFGKVVDQNQDRSGAQWGDADAKLEQLAAQRGAPHAHLLLTRMPIFDDPVNEVAYVGNSDFAAADQAQGIGSRARPKDGAVRRHHQRGGWKNAQDPNDLVRNRNRSRTRTRRGAFDRLSPCATPPNHVPRIGARGVAPSPRGPIRLDDWTNVHLIHR